MWLDEDGEHRTPDTAGRCRRSRVRVREAGVVIPYLSGAAQSPGLYGSVTVGRHVGFESWLERDHAKLLDFESAITAYAAQLLWGF